MVYEFSDLTFRLDYKTFTVAEGHANIEKHSTASYNSVLLIYPPDPDSAPAFVGVPGPSPFLKERAIQS